MGKVKKVFGAPGTGKTTYIINDIERRFNEPNGKDFGYFTFTKSQANDFKRRMMEKFKINEDDFKQLWVGTQHAICYRLLNRPDVIKEIDKKEFCDLINFDFGLPKEHHIDEFSEMVDVANNAPIGNKAFYLDSMCRMQKRKWTNSELQELFVGELGSYEMDAFAREWKAWKATSGKIDYVDMLEHVLEKKLCPPTSRLYFDEFQDYGQLQYDVYSLWRNTASEITIAGDDDQAIYGFLGADPKFMLGEEGEVIILKNNYRNTKEIYQEAYNLIEKNTTRQVKEVTCVNKDTGTVSVINLQNGGIEKLSSYIKDNEKTFILTRTNRQYRAISCVFDDLLIPYRCLRAGTPWSDEFLLFLSAIRKITKNKDEKLNVDELHEFIDKLPQKDYIYRGKKGVLMKEFNSYSFNELVGQYLKPQDANQTMINEFVGNIKVEIASPVKAATSKLKSKKQRDIVDNYCARDFPTLSKSNILLGTAHSSKGTECDTVFIVDAIPKRVEDGIDELSGLEAERRVYYVAITRAKTRIVYVYGLFGSCNGFLNKI